MLAAPIPPQPLTIRMGDCEPLSGLRGAVAAQLRLPILLPPEPEPHPSRSGSHQVSTPRPPVICSENAFDVGLDDNPTLRETAELGATCRPQNHRQACKAQILDDWSALVLPVSGDDA